jgi:hypothetical protein
MTKANQPADTEAQDINYSDVDRAFDRYREQVNYDHGDSDYWARVNYYSGFNDTTATLRTQLEAANAERDRLKQLVDAASEILLKDGEVQLYRVPSGEWRVLEAGFDRAYDSAAGEGKE